MIENVRIASPCTADWEKMVGDDRVRHCAECNLNVYNFSAMTGREVERLVAGRETRLCARFFRREDGTMLTTNCPVGLRAAVRRVSRFAGAALSAAISVGSMAAKANPAQEEHLQVKSDQTDTAMQVEVKDASGAGVSKAKVVLTRGTGEEVTTGFTDDYGAIRLSHLPPGPYRVVVDALGFSGFSRFVTLDARQVVTLDITLQVGALMGVVVSIAPPAPAVSSEIPYIPNQSIPIVSRQPMAFNGNVAGVQPPRPNLFRRMFSRFHRQ